MRPIHLSVRHLPIHLTPGTDSISELLENLDRSIPVYAGVCDADAFLERGQPTCICWWWLLVAFVDVGLDHDADDTVFALAELVTDGLGDFWLVAVVLQGVAYVQLEFVVLN